jgi:hypothetical protein
MAGRRKRRKGEEMFSFMIQGGNYREMSDGRAIATGGFEKDKL